MEFDTREVERRLTRFERKQVPFASALAINDLAKDVQAAEPRALERELDRPTPFTKRPLFIKRATKRKRTATVGFKDAQAAYLGIQATGGKRKPKRRAILTPAGIRLNKYGNMPRGSVARALAKPNTFSGTINGTAGIWQRPRGGKRKAGSRSAKSSAGLKLLVQFVGSARYSKRLKFQRRAVQLAQRNAPRRLSERLGQALKSAR